MTRIRLIRELDAGGMGRVYEGILEYPFGKSRRVAVKLLRRDKRDESSLVRFAREIETAGELSHEHENLVTSHWCSVTSHGDLYVVMQFVDVSLKKLSARGPLSREIVGRIARDMLRALKYLHANNIEHRDVSPANILMKRDGTVKLGDFGLVRRESGSVSGRVRGTPPYTSPEGYLSGRQSAASDLYSLGAVLYELVMGEPPYGKGNAREIATAIKAKRPPTPLPDDLARPLADVIKGLIQRKPKIRPTVDDALERLDASSEHLASKAIVATLIAERVPEPEMPAPDVDNTDVLLAGAVLRAAPKLAFKSDLAPDNDVDSKSEAIKSRPRRIWVPLVVALGAIALAVYVGWRSPPNEHPGWPEQPSAIDELAAARAPANDAAAPIEPLATDVDQALEQPKIPAEPPTHAAKEITPSRPSDTRIRKNQSTPARVQLTPKQPGPSSTTDKSLIYAIPRREIPPMNADASP